MIKYYSSENEKGVFIVDGVKVQYIGNVKDLGYWFWDFFAFSDDISKADFFETVLNNIEYEDVGFLSAYYDYLFEIAEEFNIELDEEVVNYLL